MRLLLSSWKLNFSHLLGFYSFCYLRFKRFSPSLFRFSLFHLDFWFWTSLFRHNSLRRVSAGIILNFVFISWFIIFIDYFQNNMNKIMSIKAIDMFNRFYMLSLQISYYFQIIYIRLTTNSTISMFTSRFWNLLNIINFLIPILSFSLYTLGSSFDDRLYIFACFSSSHSNLNIIQLILTLSTSNTKPGKHYYSS